MSANQPGGNAAAAIAIQQAEDIRSLPLGDNVVGDNVAAMIAEVFTAAARRGAGRGDPFEAAIRAYLSRRPGTPRAAAARAVADIICRRSWPVR